MVEKVKNLNTDRETGLNFVRKLPRILKDGERPDLWKQREFGVAKESVPVKYWLVGNSFLSCFQFH